MSRDDQHAQLLAYQQAVTFYGAIRYDQGGFEVASATGFFYCRSDVFFVFQDKDTLVDEQEHLIVPMRRIIDVKLAPVL